MRRQESSSADPNEIILRGADCTRRLAIAVVVDATLVSVNQGSSAVGPAQEALHCARLPSRPACALASDALVELPVEMPRRSVHRGSQTGRLDPIGWIMGSAQNSGVSVIST